MDSTKRLQPITFPEGKVLAWFDGALQVNMNKCGAGGVIRLNTPEEYRWTLNCISGSNSKAELMGAWRAMTLEKSFGIQELHLMGDPLIVINWLKGIGTLQVANLENWKSRIFDLVPFCKSITSAHIYREHNSVANGLSKIAINSPVGHISYNKWTGGQEGPINILKL